MNAPSQGTGIRTFLALPVAPEVVKTLRELQQDLQRRMPEGAVRWVRSEQMHLTFQFYGDVIPERIPELETVLRTLCAESPCMTLGAREVGCFPNNRVPRVIWTGLTGDLDALRQLQQAVAQKTREWVEKPDDRPFEPHLTLGRVNKNVMPTELRQIGESLRTVRPASYGTWATHSLRLMRSQLSSSGPQYSVLKELPLRQA